MSKRAGCALFGLLTLTFLLVNRAAYHGYFQDDEIDAMAWTRWGPSMAYLKGALTPIYLKSFRAVGFYYFHLTEYAFGRDFPKYVAVIHVIHLLNAWLLWLLLRKLGAPLLAAIGGCIVFTFHMALFDAVWKPMYVFDVLCCTFSLLGLLLWARGHWILSFVSFWLAYKSKELAVMLPVVLLCYELWFGQRRWLKLAPFFAASASFALQALLLTPTSDGDYTFRFSREVLAKTAGYYAGNVFLVPNLGFALPLGLVAAGNRRTWFGLSMMLLFFFPLLWLPGRVLSAYCYLPFAGLAIALAGFFEEVRPPAVAAFFLLMLPAQLQSLRQQRNDTLRCDRAARAWMLELDRFAAVYPDATGFVYHGVPEGWHNWGLEAAAKYTFRRLDVKIPAMDSPEGAELVRSGRATVLHWDAYRHKLDIQVPQSPPMSRRVKWSQ